MSRTNVGVRGIHMEGKNRAGKRIGGRDRFIWEFSKRPKRLSRQRETSSLTERLEIRNKRQTAVDQRVSYCG